MKPTSIQAAAIPILIQSTKTNDDVLVQAPTGSGKTLVYLAPLINHLLKFRIQREDGTYAIIMAPTRELCMQIYNVLIILCNHFHWIIPGIVIGGEKKKSEKARLRRGVNILIGTPGRLLDHINNTSSFRTDHLMWIILDEADRLLDMGFEKDVIFIIKTLKEKIVSSNASLSILKNNENYENLNHQNLNQYLIHVPHSGKVHTVLLSATLHEGVQRLANISLNNYKFVSVDSSNNKDIKKENQLLPIKENFHIPEQLSQYYIIVPCKKRLITLAAFLHLKAIER